jgi:DNA invertase Pin-like site-specific DNA recombinase
MTSAHIRPGSPTAHRTVLYLRQSSDPDNDELAVARQRGDCRTLCERRGWTVDREFIDNDESASPERRNNKPRPAYELMLSQVRAGRVGRIVVQVADRLYRHPRDLEDLIDVCNAHRVALVTASGDLDLSTDAGRLVARILGAVGRGEMERKSRRQRDAARQRAETGRAWWSSRPFGYQVEPGPDGQWSSAGAKRLCEAEAEEVRRAYRAVQAGSSLRSIAADWNQRGVTTPKGCQWRGAQVRQLLLNGRNAGLREYRGEVVIDGDEPVQGDWPAIVTEDTWRSVRGKLAEPSRRSGPTRGRKRLLSGIAICGACGQLMGSGITTTTQRFNYICKHCMKVSRNGDAADAIVVAAVVGRLSRDDAADLVTDDRPDVDALREQRKALRDQQTALGVQHGLGNLSLAAFTAADRTIAAQLDALDAVMNDADKAHIFGGLIGGDVQAAWDGLDLDRQRTVVDALMTVTILPSGRGKTFKPESIAVAWK